MSELRFTYGQDVFTSDGDKIGDLSAIVIDAGRMEMTRIMIDPGIFGGPDKMVDVSAVSAADGGRLTLQVDKAAAEHLQQYAKEQYIDPRRVPDAPIIMPASGVGGPVMYDNPDTGMGLGGDMYDPAPIDAPRLQILSNLGETEVILKKGSEVIASDYHKVGDLDELTTDAEGRISGFTCRAGFLFGHDVRVPMSAVKEFGTDRIRLHITRDEAESGSLGA